MLTTELFLLTRNPLTFMVALPVHGLCVLACLRDPRFFDLAILWLRTRLVAYLGNFRWWACSSYSPLTLDLPDRYGRRRELPNVRVASARYATPSTGRGR
ncbi:MAG: VirB3 family type IV secretion system protein [Gammaproteobacteria bacterium]